MPQSLNRWYSTGILICLRGLDTGSYFAFAPWLTHLADGGGNPLLNCQLNYLLHPEVCFFFSSFIILYEIYVIFSNFRTMPKSELCLLKIALFVMELLIWRRETCTLLKPQKGLSSPLFFEEKITNVKKKALFTLLESIILPQQIVPQLFHIFF